MLPDPRADAGARMRPPAGTKMVEQRESGERVERRELLRGALAKARTRVARRIRALEGDLDRIAGADALSARARIFVAEAARAPRGTAKLTATDWTGGEAAVAELPLDPARSPKEQVEAIFRHARRLKGGAPIAQGRLRDARGALERLDALAAIVAEDPEADLEDVAARARAAAPRDFAPPPKAPPAAARVPAPAPRPYRTFAGASGALIWVGRGAAHNDALTLHVARPHHLWLHAKGQAGAHVVVPLAKGAVCSPDLLVEAAHLAAHFSRAREEPVVEVTYAPRRYVRKPRGSAPGLVVVDREKTLVLRRSDALLRRLLDRELAG